MVRGHPPPRWPIVSRGDTRRCVSRARALAWLWACVWTHAATSAPRRFSLLITRVPALMFAVTSWKVLWWQPRTNSCQGNGLLCHCVQPHRQKFTPSTYPYRRPLPERNLTRLDLAQTSYSTNNQSARLNFSWNRSSRRQLYIIFDSAIMNDIHAIPLLRDPSISLSTALSTTHDLYMRERRDKSLKVKENKDSLVY